MLQKMLIVEILFFKVVVVSKANEGRMYKFSPPTVTQQKKWCADLGLRYFKLVLIAIL